MFEIDAKSRLPIYEQIVRAVETMVLRDVLAPDDKLPSVRQLASDLGINPNTIAKAYAQLENLGIIYSVAGRGSFISQNRANVQSRKSKELSELLADTVIKIKTAGVPLEKILTIVNDAYNRQIPHSAKEEYSL